MMIPFQVINHLKTNTMTDIFETLSKSFAPLPTMELAAIWLDKPVVTNEGKTVRLCRGHQVLVVNDKLVDVVDDPSHQVLKVFGKSNSDFSILLVDLCNFDLLTIKLP